MQISGEHLIDAPREMVWRALNDPLILKQCIPGCETIERISDTEFTAKVAIAVGPVRAKFSGRVLLSNLDPPNGYTIAGEGQGGVAGFGKGGADVRLTEDGETKTILTYRAEASVGGKLAQVGARIIDSTARKLADQFFAKFTATVGGAPAQPSASAVASVVPAGEANICPETGAASTLSVAASEARTGVSRQLMAWMGALAIGAGVVLLLATQ